MKSEIRDRKRATEEGSMSDTTFQERIQKPKTRKNKEETKNPKNKKQIQNRRQRPRVLRC